MTQQAQPVAGKPKAEQVRAMFNEIAENYDLANTVMSAGIHPPFVFNSIYGRDGELPLEQ